MGTASIAIKPCKCVHEYQDAQYGYKMRVCNLAPKKAPNGAWVCTVCKAVHPK